MRYKTLSLFPKTHIQKQLGISACVWSQHQGGRDRQIPNSHWLANLACLVSARLMKADTSKDDVDSAWEMMSACTHTPHMRTQCTTHAYTHAPHMHTHIHTHARTHVHTCTRAHTYTTHAHTMYRTCIHTCTAHAHTHAHEHTCNPNTCQQGADSEWSQRQNKTLFHRPSLASPFPEATGVAFCTYIFPKMINK